MVIVRHENSLILSNVRHDRYGATWKQEMKSEKSFKSIPFHSSSSSLCLLLHLPRHATFTKNFFFQKPRRRGTRFFDTRASNLRGQRSSLSNRSKIRIRNTAWVYSLFLFSLLERLFFETLLRPVADLKKKEFSFPSLRETRAQARKQAQRQPSPSWRILVLISGSFQATSVRL